jgi:hypothetical protein
MALLYLTRLFRGPLGEPHRATRARFLRGHRGL